MSYFSSALTLFFLIMPLQNSACQRTRKLSPTHKICISAALTLVSIHALITQLEAIPCPTDENGNTCWEITNQRQGARILCATSGQEYGTIGDENKLLTDLKRIYPTQPWPTVATCKTCPQEPLLDCKSFLGWTHSKKPYLEKKWAKYTHKQLSPEKRQKFGGR